jgi:hypothetical protein
MRQHFPDRPFRLIDVAMHAPDTECRAGSEGRPTDRPSRHEPTTTI